MAVAFKSEGEKYWKFDRPVCGAHHLELTVPQRRPDQSEAGKAEEV